MSALTLTTGQTTVVQTVDVPTYEPIEGAPSAEQTAEIISLGLTVSAVVTSTFGGYTAKLTAPGGEPDGVLWIRGLSANEAGLVLSLFGKGVTP